MDNPQKTARWKKRIIRFFLTITTLLVVGVIGYQVTQWGYCNGRWGRDNLWFRANWACACDPALEQSFFPDEHVTILFPGCSFSYFGNSFPEPVGYMIIYTYTRERPSKIVFYDADPSSQNELPFSLRESTLLTSLVDDSWVFFFKDDSDISVLWNWRTNEELEVEILTDEMFDNALELEATQTNPQQFAELFGEVDFVYTNEILTVFVNKNREDHITSKFVLNHQLPSGFDLPSFLEDKHMIHNKFFFSQLSGVSSSFCLDDITSPNGQFVATREGVFVVEDGRQIISTTRFIQQQGMERFLFGYEPVGYAPCVWSADSRSVVYDYNTRNTRLLAGEGLPIGNHLPEEKPFPVPILQITLPTGK